MTENSTSNSKNGTDISLLVTGNVPRHLLCCLCKKSPIIIQAQWSDREMFICSDDTCRQQVIEYHDGDHDYDQTGILWDWMTGGVGWTPRKGKAYNESDYRRREEWQDGDANTSDA